MNIKQILFVIVILLLIGSVFGFNGYIFLCLTFLVTYLFAIFILETKDGLVEKYEKQESDKEDRRIKEIECIITEVKNKLSFDYIESFQVVCEYNTSNKKVTFKSKEMLGKCNYSIGEYVKVLVEPGNYRNYIILIDNDRIE